MKKPIAAITLILALLTISGAVAIISNSCTPNLEQLKPMFELYKSLVPANLQDPIVWGTVAFLFLSLILSLSTLFFAEADKSAEQLEEKNKEIKQLTEKITQAETAAAVHKEETARVISENDKFSKKLSESEEKISTFEDKIKEAQAAVLSAKKELDKASENSKKLLSDLSAAEAKLEGSQQEAKKMRSEKEKSDSSLKNANEQLESKTKEIIEFRKEIEDLKEQLKSAQADARGGKNAIPPAAYQILYLFQKEGRLIDLLKEDISEFDDETLGGAIRPIHEGCRKLLEDRLILEPVLNEEEGTEVTIDEANPESIKLSGSVPASGPYKGELIHKGWRLKECKLPELVDGWKGNVIAPAEIEIN